MATSISEECYVPLLVTIYKRQDVTTQKFTIDK
jgi:hypothetical protein